MLRSWWSHRSGSDPSHDCGSRCSHYDVCRAVALSPCRWRRYRLLHLLQHLQTKAVRQDPCSGRHLRCQSWLESEGGSNVRRDLLDCFAWWPDGGRTTARCQYSHHGCGTSRFGMGLCRRNTLCLVSLVPQQQDVMHMLIELQVDQYSLRPLLDGLCRCSPKYSTLSDKQSRSGAVIRIVVAIV